MSAPAPGVRRLLAAPGVARLLAASLVGRLPGGMVPLALVLFTRDSGDDFATAGLLTAGYAAGSAVGGPVLARLVDLSGQVRVLVAASLLSCAALALLPALGPRAGLVAALSAGLLTAPLEPCLRALWPSVLRADQIPQAYALDAAAQELVFVAGPLVVLGATALGRPAGLLAAAALGLAGGLWFAAAPAPRRWRPSGGPRHWAGALRSPRLLRLYVVVLLTGSTVGVFAVAAVSYAEGVGRPPAAWLATANATGALIGGLVFSRRAGRVDAGRSLPLLVAGLGLGYLPLAAQPPAAPMLAAAVLSGLLLPAVLTCLFLLIDGLAPVGTTTEAFAWLISAFLLGSSAGATLAGQLADHDRTGQPCCWRRPPASWRRRRLSGCCPSPPVEGRRPG